MKLDNLIQTYDTLVHLREELEDRMTVKELQKFDDAIETLEKLKNSTYTKEELKEWLKIALPLLTQYFLS